jgi:cell division inhibitor SulA
MSGLLSLTQSGKVWRLNEAQPLAAAISTGFTELDLALAGGWPVHTVIDLQSLTGIGELRLLLPLLLQLQKSGKLLIFINPPALLSSQMLAQAGIQLSQVLVLEPKNSKEACWAAEIGLKSGCCSIVLQWQSRLSVAQLKRLQLCAEQGRASHILLRGLQQQLALPVALSMQLTPALQGLNIHILKRRGGNPRSHTILNWQQHYPQLCLPDKEQSTQNHIRKVAQNTTQPYIANSGIKTAYQAEAVMFGQTA